MKAPELESDALLQHIANAVDCPAVGSLSRKTGALTAYFASTERWGAVLAKAMAGAGWAFPGVRLAAVASLINRISAGQEREAQLEAMSFASEGSRIVFQRCPWNQREVLFVVLPNDGAAEEHFTLLRQVLESLRHEVAIIRAPRVEERCWN